MRLLEKDTSMRLHVIHVSGKRMIAQGTDGLSRVDMTEGVMRGRPMGDFVPLHLNCVERQRNLKEWLLTLFPHGQGKHLTPKEWMEEGQHTQGHFLWTPPPSLGEAVGEFVSKARHKRPESLHIIAIPRLYTGLWRRPLSREADFYFKIPVGSSLWEECQHEPLLIFVCLPFESHRPWLFRHGNKLDQVVRSMREEGMWEDGGERAGALLRELLLLAERACPLP